MKIQNIYIIVLLCVFLYPIEIKLQVHGIQQPQNHSYGSDSYDYAFMLYIKPLFIMKICM